MEAIMIVVWSIHTHSNGANVISMVSTIPNWDQHESPFIMKWWQFDENGVHSIKMTTYFYTIHCMEAFVIVVWSIHTHSNGANVISMVSTMLNLDQHESPFMMNWWQFDENGVHSIEMTT